MNQIVTQYYPPSTIFTTLIKGKIIKQPIKTASTPISPGDDLYSQNLAPLGVTYTEG